MSLLKRSLQFAPILATLAVSFGPLVTGRQRVGRFVAILSTALTTGTSFAHTLEVPGKRSYDG